MTVAAGTTVGELAVGLDRRYGAGFAAVRAAARLWVNGDEPARGAATVLVDDDEVAVLPPVSGGSGPRAIGGPGGG